MNDLDLYMLENHFVNETKYGMASFSLSRMGEISTVCGHVQMEQK